METDEEFDDCALTLLQPRTGLVWDEDAMPRSRWAMPFVIDNKVTRSIAQLFLEEENAGRRMLRDQVEAEISVLRAETNRFWMAEYRNLEKFLSLAQLHVYVPGFLVLSRIMPKKQVFCRRSIIRKYLDNLDITQSTFTNKLVNQFIRASVLLYPAEQLLTTAEKFSVMASRSADQSAKVNRRRVLMILRSMHMMTDKELCFFYSREEDYMRELVLLEALILHFDIRSDEIFRVAAEDLNTFWKL
jgi:hypothetical protein